MRLLYKLRAANKGKSCYRSDLCFTLTARNQDRNELQTAHAERILEYRVQLSRNTATRSSVLCMHSLRLFKAYMLVSGVIKCGMRNKSDC
jgi:hypothetical protein